MIPTGRSATPSVCLKKKIPRPPTSQPPVQRTHLGQLEGVHSVGERPVHKPCARAWDFQVGVEKLAKSNHIRILPSQGLQGRGRDWRDGEGGQGWTDSPARTIAFVPSRLIALLGKLRIWNRGRLGLVCAREVSW